LTLDPPKQLDVCDTLKPQNEDMNPGGSSHTSDSDGEKDQKP